MKQKAPQYDIFMLLRSFNSILSYIKNPSLINCEILKFFTHFTSNSCPNVIFCQDLFYLKFSSHFVNFHFSKRKKQKLLNPVYLAIRTESKLLWIEMSIITYSVIKRATFVHILCSKLSISEAFKMIRTDTTFNTSNLG